MDSLEESRARTLFEIIHSLAVDMNETLLKGYSFVFFKGIYCSCCALRFDLPRELNFRRELQESDLRESFRRSRHLIRAFVEPA